jgi:alcohol dehydrogenase class IV
VQIAATMSLWPNLLQSSLGLSHVLGYALGSTYKIPHGICSCLTLAKTVQLLSRNLKTEDQSHLSEALQAVPDDLVANARAQWPQFSADKDPLAARAILLGLAVAGLVDALGLTSSLAEYKVPREDLPKIAKKAREALVRGGVDNVPSEEAIVGEILESIYERSQ